MENIIEIEDFRPEAAPTVDPTLDASGLKTILRQMASERDTLEAELGAHMDYLRFTPAGLDGPLKDPEGYPRNDCDVYQIRVARSRVAVLKTDLQRLMLRLESHLHALHSLEKTPGRPREAVGSQAPPPPKRIPLCVVNTVDPQSPAHQAGLSPGDIILAYGSVLIQREGELPDALQRISTFTQAHIGIAFDVVVQRGPGQETLTLVPRTWGGGGVLGCHLVPMN